MVGVEEPPALRNAPNGLLSSKKGDDDGEGRCCIIAEDKSHTEGCAGTAKRRVSVSVAKTTTPPATLSSADTTAPSVFVVNDGYEQRCFMEKTFPPPPLKELSLCCAAAVLRPSTARATPPREHDSPWTRNHAITPERYPTAIIGCPRIHTAVVQLSERSSAGDWGPESSGRCGGLQCATTHPFSGDPWWPQPERINRTVPDLVPMATKMSRSPWSDRIAAGLR